MKNWLPMWDPQGYIPEFEVVGLELWWSWEEDETR